MISPNLSRLSVKVPSAWCVFLPNLRNERGPNIFGLIWTLYVIPRGSSASRFSRGPPWKLSPPKHTWHVSGHVKSHTKHLPCDHGSSVKPSGRLPSFRDRHDGSSLSGISATVSARFIRSLTALCREWRPADRRHDRPWTPHWSTFSPHTHWCGAQIGAPRRSAVAMRNDELARRVPTDELVIYGVSAR